LNLKQLNRAAQIRCKHVKDQTLEVWFMKVILNKLQVTRNLLLPQIYGHIYAKAICISFDQSINIPL